MKDEKYNFHLSEGTKEIIIREGQAAPIELPYRLELSGDIFSPGNFAEARREQIKPFEKATHVFVSQKDLSIRLRVDEQSERGIAVLGRLKLNKHITDLKINTEASFNKQELQKALKFRRTLFNDVQNYAAIMSALEKFNVKSQTEIKQEDNRRGNVNNSFQRTTELDVPMNFTLVLPVYENTEPKSFLVEILADVRDSGVSFFLESVELADLQESVRKAVFAQELERLKDYVIITE